MGLLIVESMCFVVYLMLRRNVLLMPEKVDSWDGVRDATRYGETCYQSPVSNKVALDEFLIPMYIRAKRRLSISQYMHTRNQ